MFFTFGSPMVLHSGNSREFVVNARTKLKTWFSEMTFIRHRLRHPQGQSCMEKANEVLCDALGKWIDSNKLTYWSEGLFPVIYGINAWLSSMTNTTLYHIMFDQALRSDSGFWTLVKNTGVVDEEDLPECVDDLQGKVIDDKEDDYNNCCHIIELVEQLADHAAAILLTERSLIHSPLVTLQRIKHASIRKLATDNYLNVANKKTEALSE